MRSLTADWKRKPEIVVGDDAKWSAFGQADVALAASGTVTLELALCDVPLISCYKIDAIAEMAARRLITTWSLSLPNLIADRPVVTEFYQDRVRPGTLVRNVEGLMEEGSARQAQLDGFAKIRRRLATDRPSGEIAADIVLAEIARRRR